MKTDARIPVYRMHHEIDDMKLAGAFVLGCVVTSLSIALAAAVTVQVM